MIKAKLVKLLMRHEGLKLHPYVDTVGKTTIGIGRNLTDNGISNEEALLLLDNDINTIYLDLQHGFSWFNAMNNARQTAICDMAFNLGMPHFKEFAKMIAALQNQDYTEAAKEMLDSKWAGQVAQRAQELARVIENGALMEDL